MRKTAFSVIATGSLALFIGSGDAEASSYQVKPGDSLWKIANENNTSVASLKQTNNLTSDAIFPNQILQVASTATVKPVASAPTNNVVYKPNTAATTYTVEPGDTLSRIAQQHNTTIDSIQKLNGISDHLIYAGQNLKLTGTAPTPAPTQKPSAPAPNEKNPKPAPVASTNGSYLVVSGDTLSAIAYRHGITVTQLTNWNNLTSSNIQVGQVLKVENVGVPSSPNKVSKLPVATTPAAAPASSATTKNVIATAMSLQGTPYVFGGATTRGFDCSGFIHYVYSKAGVSVPRTSTIGLDARSYEVDKPQVGDLVFFKNTYRDGISHAGIYIGDNKFIHAGGDKVAVDSLSNSYWSSHFDSFKRLYAMD